MRIKPARFLLLRTASWFLYVTTVLNPWACQQKSSDRQILPVAADYLQLQYASFSDDSTLFVKAFAMAANNSGTNGGVDTGPVQVGIVAHHLYVADLMAEYFIKLAATVSPKTVILLGPNHRSRGNTPIATTLLPWKTAFGTVLAHRVKIAAMISSGVAAINDEAFFMEHSIGALLPFIKRVFPKAAIVPMVLRADAPVEACDRLSDWLVKHLDEETLLLASLDFSHYKTAAEAAREDSVTLPILQRLDFEHAHYAYVDSRPTLRVLLRALNRLEAGEGKIIHHTNSGLISGLLNEPCTSYINVVWKRPLGSRAANQDANVAQLTVAIGGDILLHPSIARHSYLQQTGEYRFEHLFSEITPLLKNADIAVANLEGTMPGTDTLHFSFPQHHYPNELAVALKQAGFTAISLANNHAADAGCAGLMRTAEILKRISNSHVTPAQKLSLSFCTADLNMSRMLSRL
jgi:AmmeMemoRadiSam system protein B